MTAPIPVSVLVDIESGVSHGLKMIDHRITYAMMSVSGLRRASGSEFPPNLNVLIDIAYADDKVGESIPVECIGPGVTLTANWVETAIDILTDRVVRRSLTMLPDDLAPTRSTGRVRSAVTGWFRGRGT